jgi:hypothetical protein
VAPSDPLTPVERLFMEAGHSRISYGVWRTITLPSLKIKRAFSSTFNGWPAEDLDDGEIELKLAQGWLEAKAKRHDAKENTPEPSEAHTSKVRAVPLGPPMTTTEVLMILNREIQDGRLVSIEAFESALRRTANKARRNPGLIPLSLGGQHADWWLVELGPMQGGHGGGHKLRRRQN